MAEIQREYTELKLARGIIFHQDHVLLVKNNFEGGHLYLPGGKVDPGESVTTALVREFQEELAWAVRPTQFLGCYENAWSMKKKSGKLVDILEIGFLWMIERLDGAISLESPPSMEEKISFQWVSLKKLEEIYLLPSEMREILPRFHREWQQNQPRIFWGTSLKSQNAKH
jgi:8-oxo-dGTP pyrophosphatase MutT (NUDIX family)